MLSSNTHEVVWIRDCDLEPACPEAVLTPSTSRQRFFLQPSVQDDTVSAFWTAEKTTSSEQANMSHGIVRMPSASGVHNCIGEPETAPDTQNVDDRYGKSGYGCAFESTVSLSVSVTTKCLKPGDVLAEHNYQTSFTAQAKRALECNPLSSTRNTKLKMA